MKASQEAESAASAGAGASKAGDSGLGSLFEDENTSGFADQFHVAFQQQVCVGVYCRVGEGYVL